MEALWFLQMPLSGNSLEGSVHFIEKIRNLIGPLLSRKILRHFLVVPAMESALGSEKIAKLAPDFGQYLYIDTRNGSAVIRCHVSHPIKKLRLIC